jgi:two-component system, OmpR family, sensor kinase
MKGGPGCRPGRHLRHSIFYALGATIALAVVVAGFVVHSGVTNTSQLAVLRDFASDRFAAVWDDPERRADLADSIQRHFHVRITLRDDQQDILYGNSEACSKPVLRLAVARHGRALGRIEGCVTSHGWPRRVIYGLLSLVLVLWAMSGFIARRLVRPLDELVRVVRDIGDGRLDARVELCRHHHRGELGEVAQAVNSMAEKIERQIAGQRELLAGVSHEIRPPLARLRMLVELEREASGDTSRLDAMELELAEMDALVGQLLAQSRLEFQPLERRALAAAEVAKTVLERATLATSLLVDEARGARVSIDVSLFSRALLNLVDNAQRHGQGLVVLVVGVDNDRVSFEIRDRGPGFDAKMLQRAFEPFVGEAQAGGLGLGLSLVERIVRAHGGQVRLANAQSGGAVVTLEMPRAAAEQ